MKEELEAAFKEDVSIYFDENPHDGLLETHSVDKSLEDRLRCLILFPSSHKLIAIQKALASLKFWWLKKEMAAKPGRWEQGAMSRSRLRKYS